MDIREEYYEKTKAEIERLEAAGVVMTGNAFSQVLLVKGEAEEAGTELLSAPDGVALRSALAALGYAPEDWAGLSAMDANGAPLTPASLRLTIATLDPNTVIILDEPAAAALREAFAEELASLESLEEATLQPGSVAYVLGMRLLALGGFAAALGSQKEKALMWARLKQLLPLGEPY